MTPYKRSINQASKSVPIVPPVATAPEASVFVSRTASITRARACLTTGSGRGTGLLVLGTDLSNNGRHLTRDLIGCAIAEWRPKPVKEALVFLTLMIELGQSPQIVSRDEGGHRLPILLDNDPRALPGNVANEA